MSAAALGDPPQRHHWTRQAYRLALEAGAFEDSDVQLRHGEVVTRVSPRGARHAAIVEFLTQLLVVGLAQAGGRYKVRVQDPIARTDDDEPEPDVAVVSAAHDSYADHPGPADILLLVEVSDSTYAEDVRKIHEYAEVGIPEAWLVDARRRRVIVHRQPVPELAEYASIEIVAEDVLLAGPVPIDVVAMFGPPER